MDDADMWRELRDALHELPSPLSSSEGIRAVLEEEASTSTEACRMYAHLTLAFLGERDSFEFLTGRVSELRPQDITSWLMLIDRFPPDLTLRGVERLAGIRGEDRRDVHALLVFALQYELDIQDLSGGARGRARRIHAAANAGSRILRGWAAEPATDVADRLTYLTGALQLGDREGASVLARELRNVLRTPPVTDERRPRNEQRWVSPRWRLETAIGAALSALSEAGSIDFEVLQRAAMDGAGNQAFAAYRQLEATGTSEALDVLLAIHRQSAQPRATIEPHIKRLAQTLGLVILRENGLLRRGDR